MMIIPKNISDLPNKIRSVTAMIDSMFDEIYLVGGAVRDAIIGINTQDLDFTTPNLPDDIENALSANSALKIHKEGIEFGTVSAHLGDYDLQVTTFRSDEYKGDSRNPRVSVAKDIDSDLSRRDFTINSIALSRNEIIDPYDGISDIEQRIIRAVGDAETKYKEDPLRILRAFRFVATLGFDIEETTLAAAAKTRDNLQIITTERIGDELKKLLAGKYWADALNEISEAGVLNSVVKSLDFTFEINADDVKHEFEKYSISELESLDIVDRWLYIVHIFAYAESAAGITSTDTESLAESLLIKSQVGKQIRTEVLKALRSEDSTLGKELSIEEQIEAAERQTVILKAADDPRFMIEEAKLYMLSGQLNMRDMHYGLARKNFKKALSTTESNFQFVLGFHDEEKKRIKLRGLSSYYKQRLQYYLTSIILDEKLYSKFNSTDKLATSLKRDVKPVHISRDSLNEVVDRSISYVYRKNPQGITLELYSDFLNKPNNSLKEETISRYLSQYIESMIRDTGIPPSEKASLYLQKAKIAVKGKKKEDYGLEYYDPYIDYLFNKMLAQKDLDKFRTLYDKFDEAAFKYKEITLRERRPWIGTRKYHLTSASALAYALTLALSIDSKILISEHIVNDYRKAGRGFEKNAQRYRVYEEWFSFVKTLLSLPYKDSIEALPGLERMLRDSKSKNYVDVDEEYLNTNRHDIVEKRKLLQDSYALLRSVNKKSSVRESLNNPILESIVRLYDEGLIEIEHAFALFRNYISSDENQIIGSDSLQIEDRVVFDKDANEMRGYLVGESETLEYKSSWKFNVKRYLATGEVIEDKELRWEVIKNIAGIANKRGGTLLIGVEDNRNVCGLEETDFLLYEDRDYLKKADLMDREIRNEIKNKLGQEVLALVSMDTLKYEGKTIIRIQIPAAQLGRPVIYKDDNREIYYVRSGSSTNDAGMRALMERR